jgi:hypothetical protein
MVQCIRVSEVVVLRNARSAGGSWLAPRAAPIYTGRRVGLRRAGQSTEKTMHYSVHDLLPPSNEDKVLRSLSKLSSNFMRRF